MPREMWMRPFLEHRAVLETVTAAGHGAILVEELQGIMAATGLDEGEFGDLDAVLAQLPPEDCAEKSGQPSDAYESRDPDSGKSGVVASTASIVAS